MKRFANIKYSVILFLVISIFLSLFNNFVLQVQAEDAFNITEFALPSNTSTGLAITAGPDGNLWFTENSANNNEVGRISPAGTISEFFVPLRLSGLQDIASGPDGNLWFTEGGANKIGRITPSGVINEFAIPAGLFDPVGITSGPDGNLWFVARGSNKIVRMTPTGVFTGFSIPTSNSHAYYIIAGSDGNLWFTEYLGNKIGRITTSGEIHEFQIPTSDSRPFDITAGPDGNIWFTEYRGNKIGKITPEGIISEFLVPTTNSVPYGITSGRDGNLWFTETGGKKVGRISVGGNITEYQVFSSNPLDIVLGPDNNLWFTQNTNKIGRVNLSNVISPTPTVYPIPTPTPPNTEMSLNLPYFSQNALSWGPTEYDHSSSLGFANNFGADTMDRWGCAVTSAAMILRHHGMNQMANGASMDPSSLNDWLKANKGYSTGGNGTGAYSYIDWNSISKLTMELYKAGKSSIKLEYKPENPSAATTQLLKDDMRFRSSPPILAVNNTSHFVAARGFNENTFLINDPEWNYPDLMSFSGNTYSQAKRFVRSNTDLSNITMVVNPNVEILVTDHIGRRTGKILENGVLQIYNEIPGAIYGYRSPIANPNENGEIETLGTGVNEFLLLTPESGEYAIVLSTTDSDTYALNVVTYELDGDSFNQKTNGVLTPETQNELAIFYSQTQQSSISTTANFQSIITDVEELRSINLISHNSIASSLIRNMEQAQKALLSGSNAKVLQNLNQFISILERGRGMRISERAYGVLFEDAESLKRQYTN